MCEIEIICCCCHGFEKECCCGWTTLVIVGTGIIVIAKYVGKQEILELN